MHIKKQWIPVNVKKFKVVESVEFIVMEIKFHYIELGAHLPVPSGFNF